MALIATEGFGWSANAADYAAVGQWANIGNGFQVPNSGSGSAWIGAGPDGDNYAIDYQDNNNYSAYLGLPGTFTTLFVGIRFNPNGVGCTLGFNDQNQRQMFSVQISPTGLCTVVGQYGSTLGASVPTLAPGTGWFYLEVGCIISQNAGSVTIRVNGVTVQTLTNINTVGGGNPSCQQIQPMAGAASNNRVGFTHLYACDNTGSTCSSFLGDVRVQTLLPTADASVAFTPEGLSANWQNAALVPPVPGTDFNQSSTVGATDRFAFAPMATGASSVVAVATKAILSKSDAGARTMGTVLVSGSTTATSAPLGISTGAKQVATFYPLDPHVTAPWTATTVNALTAGYTILS